MTEIKIESITNAMLSLSKPGGNYHMPQSHSDTHEQSQSIYKQAFSPSLTVSATQEV